jgi:hypothetical protein
MKLEIYSSNHLEEKMIEYYRKRELYLDSSRFNKIDFMRLISFSDDDSITGEFVYDGLGSIFGNFIDLQRLESWKIFEKFHNLTEMSS